MADALAPGRVAAESPAPEPELPGPAIGAALLEPEDRLAYERRRLPLRLLLLACPLLLWLSVGAAALPVLGGMVAASIGSFVLVRRLLNRHPAVVIRYQLGLRLVDVGLIFIALDGTNLLLGDAYFDAAYLIPVLSATGSHGGTGVLVVAAASTVAMLVERLHLATALGRPIELTPLAAAFGYTVLFAASGLSVVSLMRTSAAVVERRDRAWRAELAERNAALERASVHLAATNRELEAFAYSVSHDLRAPLRAIDGFGRVLEKSYGELLDDRGRDYLRRTRLASQRMAQLIDDLLGLSRLTRADLRRERVDLSALASAILAELRESDPGRAVAVEVAPGLSADGDAHLLRIALQNLLGNAWKFTARQPSARIVFAAEPRDGETVYVVRDDGAGFDMAYADKLFGAFQRLHAASEFEGTGIGLATVQRIVHRHGGRVWAEGAVGQGASFYFTLG